MKPHLPSSLFRAFIAIFAAPAVLTGTVDAENVTYMSRHEGPLNIVGKSDVSFEYIQSDDEGAAIHQYWKQTSLISSNDSVLFSENSSLCGFGGAIFNSGSFTLRENGDITFSANMAVRYGGAIFNDGSFTLSGNGNVLFEKNAEIVDGVYRLRSIYSRLYPGSDDALNLSASAGKSILFRDSVYASESVKLNQNGTGNIIFSGATTEADLREVKGGVDGTYSEILASRQSSLRADVTLFGGSLQLRDGVSLAADAMTVGSGPQAARLELCDASLTTATLTLESGSEIRLSGRNYLLTDAFTAIGDNTLSLTLGDELEQGTALTLMGNLSNADNLHIRINDVSGLKGTNYRVLHLVGPSDGWQQVQLDVEGAGSDDFTWVNGDLYLHYDASVFVAPERNDFTNYKRDLVSTLLLENYGALTYEGHDAGISVDEAGCAAIIDNSSVSFNGDSHFDSTILNEGTFALSGNGEVAFSGNSYASIGGAILNAGNFMLCGNGNVAFSENSSWCSSGGAIFSEGLFFLNGNRNVTFSGNSAYTSGGAIYNSYDSNFTLRGNGNVTFSGNSASYYLSNSEGGAIYNSYDSDFILSGNESVGFIGNTASSSNKSASGGAIYNDGTFTLTGNGDISFIGNIASSASTSASGGAIYNDGTFTLTGNGDISFIGNTASSVMGSVFGGAIYNGGTFTLSGNGNVIFAKNAVVENGTYYLHSISAQSSLNLSATEGHSITFRDSIHANDQIKLNQDGTGDIIFTGVSTESDLREVKGGADGTAEEILKSRTSWLAAGEISLYGGRLIVEEEAIIIVNSLSVAESARVVVKNGTLAIDTSNATITMAEGAEKAELIGVSVGGLSLSGADAGHRGVVEGAHVDLAEGANFTLQHLVLGATTRITDAPALVRLNDVTAELVMGVNASLTGSDMLMAGTTLTGGGRTLTLEENTGVVMLDATNFDSVTLRGNTLVLELAGMTLEMLDGAEYIAVSFTNGTGYASFISSLSVTLTADGINFSEGYTLSSDGSSSTKRYFYAEKAGVTPEPATATLSILALAALAARRKRK